MQDFSNLLCMTGFIKSVAQMHIYRVWFSLLIMQLAITNTMLVNLHAFNA